ncbi:glycosyltransferase [Sphingomonas sp. RP10(2022)]|uniref:Glycosyltransferase n=1 Tax=Sphingomonas liriopis TaxID=2949094 RepID=A0A9X2KRA2_9SPHN|nr:glycosyltransferase [Sphingomonas liriopis]MCP3735805.1 glycosyltransferase [Sphingomonas liriopis]
MTGGMTGAPIVSVVIPGYNGAAFIGETLESLERQTLTDWEAIVVDDCSADDTRALVRGWPDPRVRLIENEVNGGPVRTRNRGVGEARGRYVAGLDQDDLCLPERLAMQVAYLEAHPDVVLVGAQAQQLRGTRVSAMHYAPHTTPDLIAWLGWIENPLVWSTVMVRATVAHALDPFTRPEILYAEDFDLYHRVAAFGRVARIDTPLLLYRQHDGGASKRFTETMRASAMRVLAERHAALLGEEAAAALARLLVLHNMGGVPVPDRATLVRLGEGIAALQAAFLAEARPDAESAKLIRWETARRWGAIGRAGLRSGAVGLGDVLAARPPHLGLGYAGLGTLLGSAAVGAVRRVRATARRRGDG